MDYTLIYKCVDEGLQEWKNLGLMQFPDIYMPPEMIDTTRPQDDGWIPWKPVASTVTDADIAEIEAVAGIPFPKSFTLFLQYKHFYELGFPHPMEVVFWEHPLGRWKKKYLDCYTDEDIRHQLLARRYLPFADYYDWGLLCFDANHSTAEREYPITLLDHDLRWTDPLPMTSLNTSFLDMVSQRLLKKT